jgi:hypothetical protein
MAGVTYRHAPARLEEGGNQGSGKGTILRQGRELLIEQPNELRLVQAIDESPHQCPQVGRRRRDGRPRVESPVCCWQMWRVMVAQLDA